MSTSKILIDFTRLKVSDKAAFGDNVVTKMTGNSDFPTPDIPLADIKAATDLLHTRIAAARNGGKENTALLHEANDNLDILLRKEALYVERIADGVETVILGAGYNVAAPRGPGQRQEFSVEQGNQSGEIVLRHVTIEGARSYIWQYFVGDTPPVNDGDWKVGDVTTRSSATISGLTPLTQVWVRVAGVTTDGKTSFCKPVAIIVL